MDEFERFDPLEKAREGLQKEAMKQRVKNIIRSYRSAADVLAEPVQNAMDELERAQNEGLDDADRIEVRINVQKNEIEVVDTGRGMASENLQEWIAPDFTDKRSLFREGRVRGHKGVGMTFLAYGFNHFVVESKTNSEHYRLRLEDGRSWVENPDDTAPAPEAEIERDITDGLDTHGTLIRIRTDNQSQPSNLPKTFNNVDMTAALIERQTAIGVVSPPNRYEANVEANLVYTDSSGDTESRELNAEYRYPHQKIPEEWEAFDLGKYIESLTEEENIEPDTKDKNRYRAVYRYFKPEKLKEYVGESEGEELGSPEEIKNYIDKHEVHAYVLFAYSVNYRERIEEYWEVPGNRRLHYPGVRVATDGMVSSWRRDVSLTRAAGNKDRTWIVYHFRDVEPDLGRKNFPQEVHDIIATTQQRFVREMVNKGRVFLLPARDPTGPPEPEDEDPPAVKAYKRRETPLTPTHITEIGDIYYGSEPKKEQDVIALFNQLVGMGFLNGYQPVYFDETYTYDSYIDFSYEKVHSKILDTLPGDDDRDGAELVTEFKYNGSSILDDIVNQTKDWGDIDLLVCWNVERKKRSTSGDDIEFIHPTSPTEREFPGVTHVATVGSKGDEPVYTISLKELLETTTS
ncbi:ATP-binding protein [Halorussus salilacus]|uniref:ATP-binding protein n=1 Tax=Halorussus salilacus TaxID=2953750 RepID=UPI00209CFB9F|nr:ATP-binding protein [Halorussus salilacus]USZ66695.1 ATP-binding protein [Halorussus salilacus]